MRGDIVEVHIEVRRFALLSTPLMLRCSVRMVMSTPAR
jgi:hypothetical protein